MKNGNIQDRNLAQFVSQVKYVDEIAVTVLKGHLVLEEQLNRIIGKFLFHPEHLDAARLGFHRKTKVAQCMSLDEHDNSVWELLLAINSLRNHLAHSLDTEIRQKKFDRVKKLLESECNRSTPSPQITQMQDHEVVTCAMAMVLGFLGSFEEEVTRFRDVIDTLDKTINPHRHNPDGHHQK